MGRSGRGPLFETLPISGATRQAYASSWPSIGPRQLSLAKRTIPDWPRLRLPPPPPGGGTWERVRGVCALGVCARAGFGGWLSRSSTSWPLQSLVGFLTRPRVLGVQRPGSHWGLSAEHQGGYGCL